MQIGKFHLHLDNLHNTVLKVGITPPEALLLYKNFEKATGGKTIEGLEVTGEDKRTSVQELARLKDTYGESRVKTSFPGDAPKLPETFKELGLAGVEIKELSVVKAPVIPAHPPTPTTQPK